MSKQWQPAILICPHDAHGFKGDRVRVRPCNNAATELWRRKGCDATRFFVVHPDDVNRLDPSMGGIAGVCEHEILKEPIIGFYVIEDALSNTLVRRFYVSRETCEEAILHLVASGKFGDWRCVEFVRKET